MNILWECLALKDVLGAVAGSAQSADGCKICRYSSIRGLGSAIERNLHIAQDCAYPATAPNIARGHRQQSESVRHYNDKESQGKN